MVYLTRQEQRIGRNLRPNKRVQPTAPAGAFLKASDFDKRFRDL
jgi:hypothetical protein